MLLRRIALTAASAAALCAVPAAAHADTGPLGLPSCSPGPPPRTGYRSPSPTRVTEGTGRTSWSAGPRAVPIRNPRTRAPGSTSCRRTATTRSRRSRRTPSARCSTEAPRRPTSPEHGTAGPSTRPTRGPTAVRSRGGRASFPCCPRPVGERGRAIVWGTCQGAARLRTPCDQAYARTSAAVTRPGGATHPRIFIPRAHLPRATSLSSGAATATSARRLPPVTCREPRRKMARAVGKVR